MVHTRKSFESLNTSPRSGKIVSAKVKKRVQIQEENLSDDNGMETAPFASTRHLRYDNKARPSRSASKSKPNGLYGTRNLRSTKAVQQDIITSCRQEKPVSSCIKNGDEARSQRRRHSVDEEEFIEPSIRRSSRRRRGVYGTLNINMLTDHRYVHNYDSTLITDEGKLKKKEREHRTMAEEEFFENDDHHINMYDHVKRRHETPSPEKQGQDSSIEEGDGDDEGDEDNDDHGSEQDDSEEEEEEAEELHENKYLLRKKKPAVNRYMAPPMHKTGEKKNYLSVRSSKMYHNPPPHASPVRHIQHKRKAINMSSSTSSSEDSSIEKEEKRFERRKTMSTAKARLRALPINLTIEDISKGILKDRDRIGSSLADVDPMSIDKKVHFDSVGGLGKQIRGLKEMILFPLMYPEVFGKFKISPPRGVLFCGPPGTGKTLVARALANECSLGNQKIAFFMRKGADCLSKWVGESERQLRLLFDQAYSMRPSIIFFDEIDGLAPVRSSRQDQIHSSIVSTLLALMDGLDSRGEVVVIGATNRIDAIDPALRRPGRFDREFQFPLPDIEARRTILSIHTREWEPRLSQTFINKLADHCVGYCGADLKALCTEAAMFALRRCYPQVYASSRKLLLDVDSIELTFKDFLRATKSIVPACQRSMASPARSLSEIVKPLLYNLFQKALSLLATIFPQANSKTFLESSSNQAIIAGSSRDDRLKAIGNPFDDDDLSSDDDDDFPSIYDHSSAHSASTLSRSERYMRRMKQQFEPSNEEVQNGQRLLSFSDELFKDPVTYRPRLLLSGQDGAGQTSHLAPAILHSIEHLSVHSLDLPALYGVAARTPEEACSQLFREARRSSPSVIYMPHIHSLWNSTTESLHATLLSLLQDLPPLCPVLLLATTERNFAQLPTELKKLFSTQTDQVLQTGLSHSEERKAFFEKLFLVFSLQTKKGKKHKKRSLEVLPFAPLDTPRELSESELKKIKLNEENTLLELRIFLRESHHKLFSDRRFKEFSKAVVLEEVPDYLDVVGEPMDLSSMMQKIDCHQYSTCAQYLSDIDLITSNALKYNPNVDPVDKIIRHRACELRDTAHSLIKSQLEPEFEKACEEIIKSRQQRGEASVLTPQFLLPKPSTSTKNYPDSSISKQESTSPISKQESTSPISKQESTSPITAYNQITSTLASSSTTVDSSSQRSSESKRKSRRRKSYWFGKRRCASKKKNLSGEIENVVVEDNECEVKEAGDQNSGTTSNGSESKSSSVSSHGPQRRDSRMNGSSSISSHEPQNGSNSISSHEPQNGSNSISSHEPQNGSNSISSHEPQNGSNSISSHEPQNGSRSISSHEPQNGSSSISSHEPQNGSRSISSHEPQNGSSSIPSNEPQNGSNSISSHEPQNGSSSMSSHEPQNGSSGTNGECLNNGHTDTSCQCSSSKGKQGSSKSDVFSTTTQSDTCSNEGLYTHDVPNVDLSTEDSNNPKQPMQMGGKSSNEQVPERFPNAITATVALRDLSNVQNNKETITQEGKETEETDELQREATRSHSTETLTKWRGELQALLNEIVDMTAGCTVEMLEIYHNRLQLSVHHYRHVADKTKLIKDFSDLIAQWKNGIAT